MIRNDATERQVRAARPDVSTWLAANAGSGKTRVLTDRVARLLLDGEDPRRILCLTYTKAAASEMQNRLFKRLGEWAMLPNSSLSSALDELGAVGPFTPERLAQARTLFARAIETPGGLKIQTIHSFCAAILRRFPLEAGVSPQFSEIEDRAALRLRSEIVSDMAAGPQSDRVDGIAAYLSDEGLDELVAAIASKRNTFGPSLGRDDIAAVFGLRPGLTCDTLVDQVFEPGDLDLLTRVRDACLKSGTNDQKAAAKLLAIQNADIAALEVLERVLLTGKSAKLPFSAKIGGFPSKALREGGLASDMPALEGLMERVQDARAQRCALAAVEKTYALHRFAVPFLEEYATRKQVRGWLDFDDLILRARMLLRDPSVAAWVLYRLDGGIDHILVDEAQDTSPDQWDVIEKLAQEFTSGSGARSEVQRTIFVVGDKKQSIYSFQGADPEAFDRLHSEFSARLSGDGAGLQALTLDFSFRSSPAILELVDLVFQNIESAGFASGARHIAFNQDLPGRVDLWPALPPQDAPDPVAWFDPVDRQNARHENAVLADAIAQNIRTMIDAGETIPDGTTRRPVNEGDFLILVRRRSELFAEIIRACKACNLNIAGADRLKVGAELAVKDLGALLSFLATPEDDLSLASALKSPLFGLDEQALFSLAHGRGGRFLWMVLREKREEFPDVLSTIDDLNQQTDFLRPYDLIERILTRHGGRRKLLARLGPEAEDGINALLSQALAYERTDIPSLTGFLQWMQSDDLEIKRQLGTAAGQIRVMTVHGSKGLEAPIVILPDTGVWRSRNTSTLIETKGLTSWRMSADDMPQVMRDATETAKARDEAERLRLLYVALTRAEKWLIVAAAGDLGKKGETWHDHIRAGIEASGRAEPLAAPTGEGLRLAHGDWTGLPLETAVKASKTDESILDPLFTRHAPAHVKPPSPISPSGLGGAKALPGDDGLDEDAAKARGTDLHLLLEHLPKITPAGWAQAAEALLPGNEQIEPLLREATAVLTRPNLSFIFAPDTLAEVSLTAEIGNQRYHGTIDRLIVQDDRVLAVDFKSNAIVPTDPTQIPDGLLRQMGAYAAMLSQIYPNHVIETGILWTRSATFMRLPHDLVTTAFETAPHLDADAVST